MARAIQGDNLLSPDTLGTSISNKWQDWHNKRSKKLSEWQELRQYIYATDTSATSNSALPWKNKTTTPKLTQIRDNLEANYLATLFPKRKWMKWEAASREDQTREKTRAIEDYMYWLTQYPIFKRELRKALNDYIDYGNAFMRVEWRDERVVSNSSGMKSGFVGPVPRRISPVDIVFDPTVTVFLDTPKIERNLETMANFETIVNSMSNNTEEGQIAKGILEYMKGIRKECSSLGSQIEWKNDAYAVDGFDSFTSYLSSGYVEVLTAYGDFYDTATNEYLQNYKVIIVDRHKVVYKAEDASYFGRPQIHRVGWRERQDNLWAMGPLDNLVGLQYRIDHLENLKADCFDLLAFPPLKIKGFVQDFQWGPFEKIYVGEDGDIQPLFTDSQVLNANLEINQIMQKMEELAGAPKEAMGIRSPGEKTAYEVQRLENAASRLFQSKIAQFEEDLLEPLLNSMLEMARRYGETVTIRAEDPQYGYVVFTDVTVADLTGVGTIRPVGARHFAESAQIVQNINNFSQSPLGQDPDIKRHFSSIKTAKMIAELLEIEDWDLVEENVRIGENADAVRMQQSLQEDMAVEAQTNGIPSGDGGPNGPAANPQDAVAQMMGGQKPNGQ